MKLLKELVLTYFREFELSGQNDRGHKNGCTLKTVGSIYFKLGQNVD